MFTPTHLLRRRRGTGHVVKYLEGVPSPSKLVDHLAGADLHASAELPFFNTVPRYVDTQNEHRLSKLFFHHVLYPAGGARMPYQAVVVRGGRAVRTSAPRLWSTTADAVAAMRQGGSKESSNRGSFLPCASSPPSRPNPLAVPSSQLGSSPSLQAQSSSDPVSGASALAVVLMEDVPSSAAWTRADPARRPYFSTTTAASHPSRYRNTHAGNGPAATNTHLPAFMTKAKSDTAPSSRAAEDDVLTPLRGVVEHYWNNTDGTTEAASVKSERLQQLLVAPSAGLVWLCQAADGKSGVAADRPLPSASSSSSTSVWMRLMDSLRRSALTAASDVPVANTFAYVHTHLPPVATVSLPTEPTTASGIAMAPLSEEGRNHRLYRCRMAGGVEPVVPFAVGRPLPASSSLAPPSTPSEAFFSHISCLTRVNVQVRVPPASASSTADATGSSGGHGTEQEALAARQPSAARPSPSSPVEPWKLGGDGLDLMIPQHVRTVTERHPDKSSQRHPQYRAPSTAPTSTSASAQGGRFVLGRPDAESYLLPQRELLLTLYVPTHTEDMCAAQNNDRLQRQVRAGRAGRNTAMAWPTDQTRMTASRRALGQYANAESAAQTGTSVSSSFSASSRGNSGAGLVELVSRTSYEVRALPGDVVYIPRGWGYDVQRILGTATIHNSQRTQATAGGGDRDGVSHEFRDHRMLGGRRGSFTSSTPPQPAVDASATKFTADASSLPLSPVLTSVDVDAFCLHYSPYPELTAAQAAVYVAANYVHAGVEEFYEKGGNAVHRSYD